MSLGFEMAAVLLAPLLLAAGVHSCVLAAGFRQHTVKDPILGGSTGAQVAAVVSQVQSSDGSSCPRIK